MSERENPTKALKDMRREMRVAKGLDIEKMEEAERKLADLRRKHHIFVSDSSTMGIISG